MIYVISYIRLYFVSTSENRFQYLLHTARQYKKGQMLDKVNSIIMIYIKPSLVLLKQTSHDCSPEHIECFCIT